MPSSQSILHKSTSSLSILLHTHTRELPSLHASLHHYTFCMYQQHPTPRNVTAITKTASKPPAPSGRGAKPCKQAQKAHSFTHLHIKNTPSNHISKKKIRWSTPYTLLGKQSSIFMIDGVTLCIGTRSLSSDIDKIPK